MTDGKRIYNGMEPEGEMSAGLDYQAVQMLFLSPSTINALALNIDS